MRLNIAGVFVLAAAAQASEIVCPPTLNGAEVAGWQIILIESDVLTKKPQLRRTSKESWASITHEFDRHTGIGIPEDQSEVELTPDGSLAHDWDYRGVKAQNRDPRYFTCVYADEAWKYARKLVPKNIERCRAFRPKDGPRPVRLICEP